MLDLNNDHSSNESSIAVNRLQTACKQSNVNLIDFCILETGNHPEFLVVVVNVCFRNIWNI